MASTFLLAGCTPPGPRALLEGKRLIEKGKYPQAVDRLKTAATLLPTNAQAWNYFGLACHYAGKPAEAEKAYQHALALNRDLTEARYNLGCLLLEQNKTNAARTEFTACALRRGNSIECLLKLGLVQLRLREFVQAEKSFTDALRLDSQNAEAMNGLGLAQLGRGRVPDAVQRFESALRLQPGYRPSLLNLAIVSQQSLKDRRFALERYKEYLALQPPPQNLDAVKATVRDLEAELASPRPAPINAPVLPPANPARPATSTRQPAFTNASRTARNPGQ
jgi:Flp pilus assembly protein TadD